MRPLDFVTSAPLTIGVELELQLLSTRDCDLTRGASDLLALLDRDRRFVSMSLGRSGTLVIAVLFAMTGASLEFQQLQTGATIALALAAVRAAGKAIGVFAMARPSALSLRKASLLAIGLVPMSGLALLLVQDTMTIYPGLGPDLAAVMFSAIVILELVGPLAVHFALTQSGDAAPRA